MFHRFCKAEIRWKDHYLWIKMVLVKIIKLKVHSTMGFTVNKIHQNEHLEWANSLIWNLALSSLVMTVLVKFHHFYMKSHKKSRKRCLIRMIYKDQSLQRKQSIKTLFQANLWVAATGLQKSRRWKTLDRANKWILQLIGLRNRGIKRNKKRLALPILKKSRILDLESTGKSI